MIETGSRDYDSNFPQRKREILQLYYSTLFADKGFYYFRGSIPAVTQEIGNDRRFRKSGCNILDNLYLEYGFVIHDNCAVQGNPITGKHNCYCLMSVILFLFQMGLVEISIFNGMQSL